MTQTHASRTSWVAWVAATTIVATALLLCPCRAAAQEPARSFDQLNTRVKAGDTIWVTDAQGRETKGKVRGLDAASLTLEDGNGRTFTAADVRVVQLKRHENLKGGTLVGLGIGLGFGIVLAASGCDGGGCAVGVLMLAGMGAGIGCGIDALIPENRRDVVYRAQAAPGGARLSVVPVVMPRTKALAVSFAF